MTLLHSRTVLAATVAGLSLLTVGAVASTQALSLSPAQVARQTSHVLANNGVLNAGGELRSSNDAYKFAFQTDSNLVVYRTSDNVVMWASNTQGKGGVKLHMQTTGNLAMLNSENATVWESRTTVTDESGKATTLRIEDDGETRLVRNGVTVWNTPGDPDAPKPVPTTSNRPTPTTSNRPTPTSDRPQPTSGRPTSNRPTPTASTSRPIPTSGRPTPAPTNTGKKTDQLTVGQKFLVGNGLYSKNDRFVFGMGNNGEVFLVDVDTKKQLWTLGTAEKNAYQFIMLRDGNLAVQRRDGTTLWNTTIPNDDRAVAKFVMQDDGNAVLYYGDEPVWATNTNQD